MVSGKALVLNKNWVPINVTSIRRAISLVYKDAATVVHPETYQPHDFDSWADLKVLEGEDCIRTISLDIKVPEVIVLATGDTIPRGEVPFSRRNLYQRDNYTCQYCGRRPGTKSLSIDHVVPRSRGGKTQWTNCVLACTKCNARKGNKTLSEARMKLRKQPKKPRWSPVISIPLRERRQSWRKFISDAYWNVELDSE